MTTHHPAGPAPSGAASQSEIRTLDLGRLLASGGVTANTSRDDTLHLFVQASLARHAACDWGDLDKEDSGTNDHAFLSNERIVSIYDLSAPITAATTWGEATVSQLWIITEAGRSLAM